MQYSKWEQFLLAVCSQLVAQFSSVLTTCNDMQSLGLEHQPERVGEYKWAALLSDTKWAPGLLSTTERHSTTILISFFYDSLGHLQLLHESSNTEVSTPPKNVPFSICVATVTPIRLACKGLCACILQIL